MNLINKPLCLICCLSYNHSKFIKFIHDYIKRDERNKIYPLKNNYLYYYNFTLICEDFSLK